MIPGSANPLLLATAAPTGYNIERSLRFNSADSAYLSRTPASAGNRKTWTWAGWVKRSGLGSNNTVFEVRSGASDATIMGLVFADGNFGTTKDAIVVARYSFYNLITTQVFRDIAAWYHIVLTVDTTQATSTNRIRLYVNGVQITTFSSATYPALNEDLPINAAVAHDIGKANYLSGYLADIHFIDGQALTPSSFGEFDVNNVWQPKAYTGSYGTNGFQLKFADNSAATAAALGKDTSGNGHNWTPTNLSVTAGAGNDSLVDTPTSYGTGNSGGDVRGNYCTWNPLNSVATLANGNLDISATSQGGAGTISVAGGDFYWEITPTLLGQLGHVGVLNIEKITPAILTTAGGSDGVLYRGDGVIYRDTGSGFGVVQTGLPSYTVNDVISITYTNSSNTIRFYKNGTAVGSAITMTAAVKYTPFVFCWQSSAYTANFGQRPFAYPVSGFKALCTANLPTPTIANPATAMDVLTWTGTDSGTTRSFTGLNFSPDLIWTKNRSKAYEHLLYDSVRGTGTASLTTNTTAAEGGGLPGQYGYLSAFGSQGFTFTRGSRGSGADPDGYAYYDELNAAYVAWAFDAGSSTVTNTSGTITSQVRANASAGFSIVTYTAGASNSTVGHGLGVTPSLIIAKSRTGTTGWAVYHTSLGGEVFLTLNETSAANATTPGYWGTPNSATFGVSASGFFNNNGNMVAYCFAPVAGYSAFGSYTGNGSADGPFVYTGFRPRWVMIKCSSIGDAFQHWHLFDTSRSTGNISKERLQANSSAAEDSFSVIDLLSSGFKIRYTDGYFNQNGSTWIYACFAESPFAYARAR